MLGGMRIWEGLVGVVLVSLVAGGTPPAAGSASPPEAQRSVARVVPSLRVTTEVSGLTQPWDVKQLPGGPLIMTERHTKRLLVQDATGLHPVAFDNSAIWASGEAGLMSLAVDRGFRDNRVFYTCHARTIPSGHDIAVLAWRLGGGRRAAAYVRTVINGIQITTGRHAGCRLLITPAGAMYVGTGDSAVETNPQDLTSLNGKVLRLVAATGRPWPTNPYVNAVNRRKRFVLTHGHRNVQGLALRADGSVWSVEHGTNVDDEVNWLRKGGDYGWDPGPGYDESEPMTDHSLPGVQLDAQWSSGPTIATSGAVWVRGRQWGEYAGTLAVAALKGSRVLFFKFDADGDLRWVRTPAVLQGFGRLRSVTRVAGGDLLVTTANGTADRVLRVHPRG
jgi:glucose/arabinose dehydrogenase